MTLAIALENVLPGALYSGSLTADTPEAYASIQWLDTRPKPPYESLIPAKGEVDKGVLKEYAAKLRYKRQRKGFTYRGQLYNSDANSITALTMAFSLAKHNTGYSTQWKMADGKFRSMDAQNIVGVYGAVTGFVQSLFNAEAVLSAAIDAGSVKTKDQVYSAINSVPSSS